MATIYVRSTDGDNADDGSTWALAKVSLAGADAIDAAGDTIYVSDNHAESTASALTLAFAGTAASPTRIICGDDAAEPPTTSATTATVATTGASTIEIRGSVYCYGIAFSAGSVASAASISLQRGVTSPDCIQVFDNCDFIINTTSGTPLIGVGSTSASNAAKNKFVWKNVDVKFGNSTQRMDIQAGFFHWQGGTILSGSAALSHFLRIGLAGRMNPVLIDGVDLSNLGSGTHLVNATDSVGLVKFRYCRLPGSWTGNLTTGTHSPGLRVEMTNCDNADTNYRLWIEDYAGSIKHETTIVRTGGASDGTTTLAWKMASSANAQYPMVPLESPEIAMWNETTGSPITIAVDIVHDSQGAGTGGDLQNDEIALEVQYMGTSGVPLASSATSAKSDVLGTAADIDNSSDTWTTTGLTSPVKQTLSVTFTPEEKGYLMAKVVLFRASKTVYVDPKLTVT